tara:strand:+ start:62676 stop:65468 length:2793 start_codon:yes stop_codon:yes gene_type:complete
MSFFDNKLNSIKDKVSGLFDGLSDESSGMSNLFGGAFGGFSEAFDGIYDAVSGVFKPQFETMAEAEDALFNEQPKPPAPGSIYESSVQDAKSHSSYGDVLMVRSFVRNELANRERDFGLYYTSNGESAEGVPDNPNDPYTGEMYRGPRSAWVRICSNSLYQPEGSSDKYTGFVMHGVNDFKDIYGFSEDSTRESSSNVIGYDVFGKPHTVKEKMFHHRPCPGITGIDSKVVDNMQNGRESTIKLTCWSRSQLDYLQPYFFNPGISIVLEWGWNTFPRDALIDLKDEGSSQDAADWSSAFDMWDDDVASSGLVGLHYDVQYANKHIMRGRGNYMFLIGMITNFDYSIRDDGGYDCSIEIKNVGSLAHEQKTKNGKKTCGTELTEDEEEDVTEDEETRTQDFEDFVNKHLTDYLDESDDTKGVDVTFDAHPFGKDDGVYMDKVTKGQFTRGRYFTPDPFNAKSSYELGFSETSYYITFGLFVDFVNEFYGKTALTKNGSNATLFKFTCERTRCAAHPNIKSLNGDVLLIPNSTAPRRNGGPSTSVDRVISASTRGVSSQELKIAMMASASTGGKKADDLATALKLSPRDDLFEILANKAIRTGNQRQIREYVKDQKTGTLKKEWITEQAVKPFPDYVEGSGGYSGRLKDLFINVEIIKDAVSKSVDVKGFMTDVLNKMSEASGGLWSFNLGAEDKSVPNCPVMAIVDRNYSGLGSTDERQRSGEIYTFNSHVKNSIVQGMSLSVELSGEVATEVMGSANAKDSSKETRAFQPLSEDRIINKMLPNECGDSTSAKKAEDKDDIDDPERYIVFKKIEVQVEKGLFEWDGVDTNEIKIEMVDTNRPRAMKSMRNDQNPQNNVNYNGPVNPIKLEITLMGIAGFRVMEAFNCTGIPTLYFTRGHFTIIGITDSISNNSWTTTIEGTYVTNSNEIKK